MSKRITDLPLKLTLSNSDIIPIVDLDGILPVIRNITLPILLADIPTFFSASGDISGTVLVQKVIAMQNIPVSSVIPTNNQYLSYNNADGYWAPVILPSGFSAGGDLSGTYLSQNVNAIRSATTSINVSSASAPSSGQALTATSSTAATWQTPAASPKSVTTLQTFTSSGSWTAPAGVTNIMVIGWGGGGGGGYGGNTSPYASYLGQGGGGGGGAMMNTVLITVVPGTTYTITIGAAATTDVDGANTTFGSLATFPGGGKGWFGVLDTYNASSPFGNGGLSNRYQYNNYSSQGLSPAIAIQSGGSTRIENPYISWPYNGGACRYNAPTVGVGTPGAGNGGGGGCGGDGSSNGSNGGISGVVVTVGSSAPANSGNGGGGGGGGYYNYDGGKAGGSGGTGKLMVFWIE